jgi:hypothetical protein
LFFEPLPNTTWALERKHNKQTNAKPKAKEEDRPEGNPEEQVICAKTTPQARL